MHKERRWLGIRGTRQLNLDWSKWSLAMSENALQGHLKSFWPNRSMEYFSWELGPINKVLPGFAVCRVTPQSSQDPWVYVTIGASRVYVENKHSVEFLLLAPDDNARHVETLAIVAHYHAT